MIKSLLCGLTVGSVGTLMAMQYHLVRTDERFIIVSRVHQPPLRSAYVDIRAWSPKMWDHYPELQEAVVKAGRKELMSEKKPADATSTANDQQPLRDVSNAGGTPILHAAEAKGPSPAKRSIEVAAQQMGQGFPLPQINLGPAETGRSVVVPNPTPEQAEERAASSSLLPFPAIQKMVPALKEPQGNISSMQTSATAALGSPLGTNRDWVQNLLKSIAPVKADSSEPGSQPPSDPLPEAMPKKAASISGEHFPASPRRITVPGGRDI